MYTVFDEWEGKEFLGMVNTMKEVRETARQRYEDTDGECQIWYYEDEIGFFLDKF